MRSKLGEILVREKMISAEQLEAALRAQVIYGGRLGTNLVELEAIDLDTLTKALSMKTGVPAALQKHFDSIQPEAIALVPARLAEKHNAVPLGFTPRNPKMLVVAFADPQNTACVDDVAFAAGMRIMATIAPEMRIVQFLEKLYGIQRKMRYLCIESLSQKSSATTVDGVEQRTASISESKQTLFGPHGSDLSCDTDENRPALSAAKTVAAIANASNRNSIGDAIVDYFRSGFGCGLILIVRDAMVQGWKGFAHGVAPNVVESLALPLAPSSIFKMAYERRSPFRGAPPLEGAALNARFWKMLGAAAPSEILTAPVLLRDRVVLLIYAHGLADTALPDDSLPELAMICSAATSALVRLIQNAKSNS